jgi:hypothetical protein
MIRSDRTLPLASLTVLVFVLGACADRGATEAGDELPSYGSIEPVPFLTLGAQSAGAHQQFLRIAGVHRLRDGNLVVADASQELRWFDSEGRLIRRVGVHSDGQVDRDLMWMRGYRGDSLIAYDAASGELSVLDAQGVLARRFRFETGSPPGFTLPDSPFPDGALLAMAGPSHVQEWRDGWWAVLRLVSFTPEGHPGEHIATALRHPCGPVVEYCAGGVKPYSGTWTAGPAGTYVARPDRAEITVVTRDSVEFLAGPEAWEREQVGAAPTYSRLLVDVEGRLWAQSGDHSRAAAAVFDAEGELEGIISVPSQLQIHQVGSGFVVGVVADATGVERVQVHTLHRGMDR